MLTTLLFIAIIISYKMFASGFMKLYTRLIPFSNTKLNVRLTTTTFYDDEDEFGQDKRKKYNHNYDYCSDSDCGSDSHCGSGSDFNFNNHLLKEDVIIPNNEKVDNNKLDNSDALYTLIWFECYDCRKILSHFKSDRNKILYIDGSYYFFDENDETNTPLFYKNDELIATDVFSIYEELFYNKIIE